MTTINIEVDKGHLAPHGKKLIAHAMFHKGKQFVHAAILLDKQDGYRDVVLHLFRQGLEIIQKGILLVRNFDKYAPKLQRPLGHNLVRGFETLCQEFNLKPVKKTTLDELQSLSDYYSKHLLRYGGVHDVLGGGGHNLEFERVFRRATVLIRFGNKLFN